ncbi:hypothetical protein PBY51_016636 [Eleginops maclovinus]|uniref:Rho-GAP domain-containing protein n=1 Tax=Eleginops maclovinus TaxID=56733 RepID=A0AAN7W7T8_ELEMC|nr:hypothetical protein PBY51_016636 [Eleginops maclovinus]
MDVLEEEEEEEEQLQDVKRMISRLPRENGLLLRYLLAMLRGIQGNAEENQMTSFNLSVCIAPSMLWAPGAPCSPEVEGEGTKRVCELVKFMIEHCQLILGEDPCSLFGGPPQRLTDEMGSESWLYPLTDSSYDSLENELDVSGSPGFCSPRRSRAKPLQGSLDSILTLSDCEPDTDPDSLQANTESLQGLKLHLQGRTSGRRQDADFSSSTQDAPTLDSVSLQRPRRCSEPAIKYVAKFRPCVSGRSDGLHGKEAEDELALTLRSAALRSPSLSSSPNSPTATRSSLDSLDSDISDHTWATRRGLHPIKTQLPPSYPPVSAPSSISPALPSSGHPGSPPKEALNWGTLKGCRGLHPNSWLKKGRKLSLTQQENAEKEEEDKTGAGPTRKAEKGKAGEKGAGNLISISQPKPKTSCRASKDAGGGSHSKGRPAQQRAS